jgi:two-component system cell cycle response regulator DivK
MIARKTQVLVVEDDAQNLYLIEFLLEQAGFDVVVARDGEQALIEAERACPDLVLTDMSLPKLDGFEVARRLKGSPSTAHVPIVAVSAYSMKGDRERILRSGCDGYIAKPIDADTFIDDVRCYLAAVGD